jgi:acetyltransferase-like isoleucine patch superfamily enzyme
MDKLTDRSDSGQGRATATGSAKTDLPLVERLKRGGSPFRQYQTMMVGKRSLTAFAAYEFIFGWVALLPGAPGYFLRKKLFPLMMARTGSGVLFGRNICVRSPGRVALGDNVVFDDGVVLDAKGDEGDGIVIGNNVWIGRNTILTGFNGTIRIGDNVSIGPFCTLASHSLIEIGSNVSVSPYCSIQPGSKDTSELGTPLMDKPRTSIGNRIGNNVWIGAGVVFLDEVEVGDDVIIGAGAVVRNNVPPRSVAAGVPARVVKTR